MTPKALRDDVIVRPRYQDKTDSGLIISGDAWKKYEGQIVGEVVSVGPDYRYSLKPGDKIIWRRHEGVKIELEGDEYIVLKSKWAKPEAKIEEGI